MVIQKESHDHRRTFEWKNWSTAGGIKSVRPGPMILTLYLTVGKYIFSGFWMGDIIEHFCNQIYKVFLLGQVIR